MRILCLLLLLGWSLAPAAARALTPPDSTDPTAATHPVEPVRPLFDPPPWPAYAGASVGYTHAASPFRTASPLYLDVPPVRYNRAEGLVVGLHRDPLNWHGSRHAKVFGQVGYATALRDIRYAVGGEVRVYETRASGLKLGAFYHENTHTIDAWKSAWVENSLAALVAGYDAFDYYEAQGVRAYAMQRLGPALVLSGGFEAAVHRSLPQGTDWSVFGDRFRPNPAIAPGQLHAVVLAATTGRVRNRASLPTGHALRVTAELGQGVGGDFSFNRYRADARAYLRTSDATRLLMRLRGGYGTAGTPIQRQFALGGRGTMRGYPQNAFRGTQALVGTVSVLMRDATLIDPFDDVFLSLFADAGWVGAPGVRFAAADVLPSAGFGIGLDDRQLRLEVAWPLRNVNGEGYRPSIGLRIAPNF
ncbi:BamA/TamA family outer membrane protein [Salisaeta longa]|uniref:BamA/TamA family outer membrane protein n=1 Tax=Salisaeta longa TaxID=503170 RepID=UPI0003B78ABD|nr:BamA/TamA family outer membrane protein [Salisaeta longa]